MTVVAALPTDKVAAGQLREALSALGPPTAGTFAVMPDPASRAQDPVVMTGWVAPARLLFDAQGNATLTTYWADNPSATGARVISTKWSSWVSGMETFYIELRSDDTLHGWGVRDEIVRLRQAAMALRGIPTVSIVGLSTPVPRLPISITEMDSLQAVIDFAATRTQVRALPPRQRSVDSQGGVDI